ncbi:MAG: hypothetical protein KDA84_19105, partial [Planctomycetaceae bacterium]|nr:hypothetical protein [Planctomycetaceae bacterium]
RTTPPKTAERPRSDSESSLCGNGRVPLSDHPSSQPNAIETTCPNCGKFYRVGGYRAGWQVRCKDCRSYFKIPDSDAQVKLRSKQCEFCSSDGRLLRCRRCSKWGCSSCVYRKKDNDGISVTYTSFFCHRCHTKEFGEGILGCLVIAVAVTVLSVLAKKMGLH